jgi:hypothetical protein
MYIGKIPIRFQSALVIVQSALIHFKSAFEDFNQKLFNKVLVHKKFEEI